jgi:hypothetical protein
MQANENLLSKCAPREEQKDNKALQTKHKYNSTGHNRTQFPQQAPRSDR